MPGRVGSRPRRKLSSKLGGSRWQDIAAYLDEFGVELNSFRGIGDCVSVCFGFDVCLKVQRSQQSVTRPRPASVREGQTNLRSVCEEGRFLVVGLDGLGIEVDGGGKVTSGKGLVALVLEVDGLVRHGEAG